MNQNRRFKRRRKKFLQEFFSATFTLPRQSDFPLSPNLEKSANNSWQTSLKKAFACGQKCSNF